MYTKRYFWDILGQTTFAGAGVNICSTKAHFSLSPATCGSLVASPGPSTHPRNFAQTPIGKCAWSGKFFRSHPWRTIL